MATRGRRELLTLYPQPYPIFLVLCIVVLLLLHSTGFSIHNPPSNITSSSFCHSCRGRPNWAITISPLLILLFMHRSSSESSALDIVSSAAKMGSSSSVPWGLAVFVGMFLLVAVLRLRRLCLLLLRLVYFTYLPFRDILFTWEMKMAINTMHILLLAILLTTVFLWGNEVLMLTICFPQKIWEESPYYTNRPQPNTDVTTVPDKNDIISDRYNF